MKAQSKNGTPPPSSIPRAHIPNQPSLQILLLIGIVLQSPLGNSINKVLAPASDIGNKVLMLKNDNSETCSTQIIRYLPSKECSDQTVHYTLLSADHCMRASKNNPREPEIFELYKNAKSKDACVEVKTKNAQSTRSEDDTYSFRDSFHYVGANRSPYSFNQYNFVKLLSYRIKPLATATMASVKKNPVRKSRASDKNTIKPSRSKALIFKEIKAYTRENESFVKTGQPISTETINGNKCTDLLQQTLTDNEFSKLPIEPFELADSLPALNEPVFVLGFQFGCNPVRIECTYRGGAYSEAGFQHVVLCPDGSKSYEGVSGGAIVNSNGKLIGITSSQGGYSESNLPFLSFSPTLTTMINCNG